MCECYSIVADTSIFSTASYSCICDYKDFYYNEHEESDKEYSLISQKWQGVFFDIATNFGVNKYYVSVSLYF